MGPPALILAGVSAHAAISAIKHEPTPGAEMAALEKYEDTFGCLTGTAYDTAHGDATHGFVDQFNRMQLTVSSSDVGETPATSDQDQLHFRWDHESGELTPTEQTLGMFATLGSGGIDCSVALGDTQ